MKFFTTSEMDVSVSEKIRPVRNVIEKKIITLVGNKNFGDGVTSWSHIIICCDPVFYEKGLFQEIKKYTKKEKDVELRIRIDYNAILNANSEKVYKLISESFLTGIDIAENELNIHNFSFKEFRNDLNSLFQSEGWI